MVSSIELVGNSTIIDCLESGCLISQNSCLSQCDNTLVVIGSQNYCVSKREDSYFEISSYQKKYGSATIEPDIHMSIYNNNITTNINILHDGKAESITSFIQNAKTCAEVIDEADKEASIIVLGWVGFVVSLFCCLACVKSIPVKHGQNGPYVSV